MNQPGLKTTCERIPHVRTATDQKLQRLGFEILLPTGIMQTPLTTGGEIKPAALVLPAVKTASGAGELAVSSDAASTSGGKSFGSISWAGAITVSQWQMFSN